METKTYLLSMGMTRKELFDANGVRHTRLTSSTPQQLLSTSRRVSLAAAANKFQLRMIAESKGIDINPFLDLAKVEGATLSSRLCVPNGSSP